jgi:hypothetical protein
VGGLWSSFIPLDTPGRMPMPAPTPARASQPPALGVISTHRHVHARDLAVCHVGIADQIWMLSQTWDVMKLRIAVVLVVVKGGAAFGGRREREGKGKDENTKINRFPPVDRNFLCQTLKIRKVSGVVMGS